MNRRIITTFASLDSLLPAFIESLGGEQELLESRAPSENAVLEAELNGARAVLNREDHRHGVMFSPSNRCAALLQSMVAENPTSITPLLHGETLEAKFDTNDWSGWFDTFLLILKHSKKFEWKKPPAVPEVIPHFGKQARLAVFGDWGTGLYGAPVISQSIAADKANIDIVMHLGDVYYSGTEKEFRARFTDLWPQRAGALSRALNGNHEMYCGGQPYFNVLQEPPFKQATTYFAYQNEHWILVCLDSAYQDHDLTDDQVEWLTNIADRATSLQRLVLFSHHQPFSLLSKQGNKLTHKLQRLLRAGRIFAWYWGHEHECIVYARHPRWNLFGRCIGHGGMPEFRPEVLGPSIPARKLHQFYGDDNSPAALILDGPNPYILGEEDKYTPHGYITLEFEGQKLSEHYHDPDGQEFYHLDLT